MTAFQYGLALTFTILTTVDVLMTHRALRTGDYVELSLLGFNALTISFSFASCGLAFVVAGFQWHTISVPVLTSAIFCRLCVVVHHFRELKKPNRSANLASRNPVVRRKPICL